MQENPQSRGNGQPDNGRLPIDQQPTHNRLGAIQRMFDRGRRRRKTDTTDHPRPHTLEMYQLIVQAAEAGREQGQRSKKVFGRRMFLRGIAAGLGAAAAAVGIIEGVPFVRRLLHLYPQENQLADLEHKPLVEAIENATSQAHVAMGGLVKQVAQGENSLSEAMALPIRVMQINAAGKMRFMLVGRDSTGFYDVVNAEGNEGSTISFPNGQKVEVKIDWNGLTLSVTNIDTGVPQSTIYLGDFQLGNFTPENKGDTIQCNIDPSNRTAFQGLEITDRDGSNIGRAWAAARYAQTKDPKYLQMVQAFEKRVREFGMDPDRFIHGTIWQKVLDALNAGVHLDIPDDFFSHPEEEFPDTFINYPPTDTAVVYNSKVKLAPYGSEIYNLLNLFDTLPKLIQGLHVLYEQGPNGNINGVNPVAVADDMLQNFRLSRETGIGMASPLGYNANLISSIRTAHFGTLMTELGYNSVFSNIDATKREQYKKAADRVAAILLHMQIKDDGIIHTTNGDYYRPLDIGGLPIAWDTNLRVDLNLPVVYDAVDEAAAILGAKEGYSGIIPVIAESMGDGIAFFMRYRQLAYAA